MRNQIGTESRDTSAAALIPGTGSLAPGTRPHRTNQLAIAYHAPTDARILARSAHDTIPSTMSVSGIMALGFIDDRLIYSSASGRLMGSASTTAPDA
jgi:hypothetical protein